MADIVQQEIEKIFKERQAQKTTGREVAAISFQQNNHTLYSTVLTATQLIHHCSVDHYDPDQSIESAKQGYQRLPERSRITRIGSFIINKDGYGLFPNAIILSSRKSLSFDKQSSTLTLPYAKQLRVVDGQTRIEGLRYAIEERGLKSIASMQIPVVITEVKNRLEELEQFRIINGTAKSVRTDLVNTILTALGADVVPDKDHWKIAVTKVTEILESNPDSPWYKQLLMPNQTLKDHPDKIVRTTSFMQSIRPIYIWLSELNFANHKNLNERSAYVADILIAYWKAIKSVVPEAFENPDNYVIQKTPGLFALHMVLRDNLLGRIKGGLQEWDEPTFTRFLKVSPEICDPNFWLKSSGHASVYGSMKGFKELAVFLSESLETP